MSCAAASRMPAPRSTFPVLLSCRISVSSPDSCCAIPTSMCGSTEGAHCNATASAAWMVSAVTEHPTATTLLTGGGCLSGCSTARRGAASRPVRMIVTAMTRAGSMPPVARGQVQTFSV